MLSDTDLDRGNEDSIGTWSMIEDHANRRVLLHFPSFVSAKMAADATAAVFAAARRARRPIFVVADLLDVRGSSHEATIAALRHVPPGPRLVAGVELLVASRIVRLAATTAAHLAGIPCTVHSRRGG
jgi:hypothetical protein